MSSMQYDYDCDEIQQVHGMTYGLLNLTFTVNALTTNTDASVYSVVTIHQGHSLGLHLQESGTISEGAIHNRTYPTNQFLPKIRQNSTRHSNPSCRASASLVPFLQFCQRRTPCGFSTFHEYIDNNNKQLIDVENNSSNHAYPRKPT